MSSIGTGYDLSAGTFSPDGRIFQVEYACKAVESSGTAVGLRGKDGVVFAVEKLVSTKLYEPKTSRRIANVDKHIGFASAGVYPDARTLAKYCAEEAQDYYFEFRSPAPVSHVADRLGMYMHAYTLYSALRPFGCAIMLSSWTKSDGPQLFSVDPSGLNYGYFGIAIGKAKQAAKTEIEKLKLSDMTVEELVKEAARIIYVTRDETKEKKFVLEISWVSEATKGMHEFVSDQLIDEAEAYAKRALEEPDSDTEMQ